MEYQIREKIAEQIRIFRLPRYEEIPNVGLYLEQTAAYINEYLVPTRAGMVTGSMISNYVKKKLISNPIRKQYNREQIAGLIFISVTKSVLSLDNISSLLNIRRENYRSDEAYNYFCEEMENVIQYVFGLKEQAQQIPAPPAAEVKTGEKESQGGKAGNDRDVKAVRGAKDVREAQNGKTEYETPGKREELDMLRNTIIAVAHKIYLDQWIEQYAAGQ